MDWDKARIIGSECDKHQCWIREAIKIRKLAEDTMNPGLAGRPCPLTPVTLQERVPGFPASEDDRSVQSKHAKVKKQNYFSYLWSDQKKTALMTKKRR